MRKLLALLIALTLVVFTGCSNDKKSETKTDTKKTESKKTDDKTDGTKAEPWKATKIDAEKKKVTVKGGKDGKEEKTFDVSDAKITRDGKDVKLSEIKENDIIAVVEEDGKIKELSARSK